MHDGQHRMESSKPNLQRQHAVFIAYGRARSGKALLRSRLKAARLKCSKPATKLLATVHGASGSQAKDQPLIVASYKQGKYLAIDLFVGDALGITADAIVFGRTKSIMVSIESQAPRFKPVPAKQASLQYPLYPRRNLLRTKSKRLPWPFAYSVQYRPRRAGPASRHVQLLASNIYQTLLYVISDAPATHVVMVPFSWRNPETLAYATIGSLLHIYPSIFQMPTRYTIAALDNLDAFERLLDDRDRIRAALSAWTIYPPPLKRIARAFKRLPLPRATQ